MLLYYLGAFFIGALPFSKLAGKLSKNPGVTKLADGTPEDSTRIYFLLDPWLIILIAFLDIGKAFLITSFSLSFFTPYTAVALAIFTILGDSYSPFLKYNGSKGIACIIGSLAAFDWRILLTGIIFYTIVLIFFHYLNLSFVITLFLIPFIAQLFLVPYPYIIVFLLLSFIITTVRHLPNIKNYLENKEPTLKEVFVRRNR